MGCYRAAVERMSATRARGPITDVLVFVIAAAVAGALALPPLAANDFDVTALLRVGGYSASRSFVEQDFEDPVLTEDAGHDGQQFYVIAATFPHLSDATDHVDKLRYRGRRILFPALVSPLPRGAPLAWGMLVVNVAAVGAAAVAVGRLAARLGASRWLGLSVAVTPAMVDSVQGVLGDAIAFAFAIWGVVVWRRRPWLAAALFLAAALSRETALVVPLACALVATGRARIPPLAAIGGWIAWAAFAMRWLPATPGASSNNLLRDVTMQLEIPFSEWWRQGLTSPSIVLGLVLLGGSLMAAWTLRRPLPEVSLWLLADLVVLVTADAGIVDRPFNFARVVPMAVPAIALAFGLIRTSGTGPTGAATYAGPMTPRRSTPGHA